MDFREPLAADFVGKIVERVDLSACNIWRFLFTDGSEIAIEALLCPVGHGYLPYMRIYENRPTPVMRLQIAAREPPAASSG